MDEQTTYILCPDETCKIFFSKKKFCQHDCPYPEEAKQLEYCKECDSTYEHAINYGRFRRKEHECIGGNAIKFQNGKYELIHGIKE